MLKKTALCIAISTLFMGANAQAATIYEKDNGDSLKLYGEVGVGGHIGADTEYGEFYDNDKNYIDDSFATMGIKGNYDSVYYRLELDYERENWKYGSGDMVLTIDKMFVGYHITDNHAVEFGLTDTAFDDYDKYGDLTFDTTVETGEAGDQANTVKYEGNISNMRLGASYSYDAESSSGSRLGDVENAYIGYFGDTVGAVVGVEHRVGSDGESKYGEQKLLGLGLRVYVTDELTLGVNGFIEDEDIAETSTTVVDNSANINADVKVYNNYQTQRNKGALVSASYKLTPKWEVTGSYNFEEYEKWAINNAQYGKADYSWDNERTWGTVGVNFRPSRSVIFALEGNFGESAQDAYAYARVYF